MVKFLEDKLLNIMDLPVTLGNKKLISKITKKMENDIEYISTKLIVLKERLKHIRGYITIASNHSNIKVAFDKSNVSKEIRKEFYEICDKWSQKYKIEIEYDFTKEVLYLK